MQVKQEKLLQLLTQFPLLWPCVEKLHSQDITFKIGGSAALFVQGVYRKPHDVDIMFRSSEHVRANKLFDIQPESIRRPNVTMIKSSPVIDGSIDFLSQYKLIVAEKTYYNPPTQSVTGTYEKNTLHFIPAEKIAVIKLLGLREHHYDSSDAKEILLHPEFDKNFFWEMVDAHHAHEIINDRLSLYGLNDLVN